MKKIAIIRIKGPAKVPRDIETTLKLLNLKKPNNCVVRDEAPSLLGMLRKVSRLVTWGEISKPTLEKMQTRRKNKVYHLCPPRGGYEKKGTKIPFSLGGAYGYRGPEINRLIERML